MFFGGPVQIDHGFVLHPPVGEWSSTLPVGEPRAHHVARHPRGGVARRRPRAELLALGYAGWAAGQLEDEIQRNGWLTVAAQDSIIFDVPAEERLPAAMELLGVSYATLADEAGHA